MTTTDFYQLGRAAHAMLLRRTPSLDEDLLEALGPDAEDLRGPMLEWLRGWDDRQLEHPAADWERSTRIQRELRGPEWLSPQDLIAGRRAYLEQRDPAEDLPFSLLSRAVQEDWARKVREKAVQGGK